MRRWAWLRNIWRFWKDLQDIPSSSMPPASHLGPRFRPGVKNGRSMHWHFFACVENLRPSFWFILALLGWLWLRWRDWSVDPFVVFSNYQPMEILTNYQLQLWGIEQDFTWQCVKTHGIPCSSHQNSWVKMDVHPTKNGIFIGIDP